jgi:hypothetical protein
MTTAVVAVAISVISLVATIVLGTKNYRKSKKLEFFQRRDQLFQTISNFNAKNSETRLSGARFTIIATEKATQPLPTKHEETNKALVADIRTLAKTIQEQAEVWDNNFARFHGLCAGYISEKDAEAVEELIAIVQLASDNIKRVNEIYLSTLHILETTNPQMATDLAEMHKMEIQLAELIEENRRECRRWLE